jgi:hypothetical protein
MTELMNIELRRIAETLAITAINAYCDRSVISHSFGLPTSFIKQVYNGILVACRECNITNFSKHITKVALDIYIGKTLTINTAWEERALSAVKNKIIGLMKAELQ